MVRRSQIVRMSSQEGLTAQAISQQLKCSDQCVREASRAFDCEGLDGLQPKTRARHAERQALDAAGREGLQAVIRRSPREFGFEGSLWTLDWLAELAACEGYVPKGLDRTTMSRLLKRLGIDWR
jgi:transposase